MPIHFKKILTLSLTLRVQKEKEKKKAGGVQGTIHFDIKAYIYSSTCLRITSPTRLVFLHSSLLECHRRQIKKCDIIDEK